MLEMAEAVLEVEAMAVAEAVAVVVYLLLDDMHSGAAA